MLVYFVCQNDAKELGYSGEKQVRVERSFVLGFPFGEAERVFYMVDGTLNSRPYVVSIIPFLRSA